MNRPKQLYYDDLESRRELYYMLSKLTTGQRVDFLSWCCGQCAIRQGELLIHPRVNRQKTIGTAGEVWLDLWQMVFSHNLDMDVVLNRLERVLRRL